MSATATLADVTPGFRDAVHGAQQTYRGLLSAMSRPGLVVRLPASAIDGIVPPASIGIGAAAILLALLDAETTIALAGRCRSAAAEGFLRFHTGARMTRAVGDAMFVCARGDELDATTWSGLEIGTDEAPQRGATLLVEVDALDAEAAPDATRLALRGPGIETEADVMVAGPPPAFWAWRIDLQRRLPCGVDVVLVRGDRIVALPRSTRLVVREGSR